MQGAPEAAADARELARALRAGLPVSDERFDAIYDEPWRAASALHWTPVDVARCAARLLTLGGARRVLDAGAGVGKLCLVGALTTEASFTGIEHRPRCVAAAQRAADQLGVTSARVLHGDLEAVRWQDFDAYYFYNPFAENVMHEDAVLDRTVTTSVERLRHDVSLVEAALASARIGTHLVTYHGWGGRIPGGYELRLCERARGGALRLWVKVEATHAGSGYELEDPPLELELEPRRAGGGT